MGRCLHLMGCARSLSGTHAERGEPPPWTPTAVGESRHVVHRVTAAAYVAAARLSCGIDVAASFVIQPGAAIRSRDTALSIGPAAQVGLQKEAGHIGPVATLCVAKHPHGHAPGTTSKQLRQRRVDVLAATKGHTFLAEGLLLLRLAAPLLLLGCSAAYDATTEASPSSRPSSSVRGSQPEPGQTLRQGQQTPSDMRQAPGQPLAPSEATAAGDGTGY
jgi:hypothetical protein